MNTTLTQKTLLTFVALVTLMCVTSLSAATFTATTTGNWNSGATWGNSGNNVQGSGYPGPADNATINSGVTVTIQNADGRTIGNTTISGQLNVGSGSSIVLVTNGGYMMINAGGTLNLGTQNGQSITFNGSVTNNGNMTVSANTSSTYTYAGVNQYLSGNITNVKAVVTGTYNNLGNFVTGAGGQQVLGLSGAGALTNFGVIYYGGNAGSTITTLVVTNVGNAYISIAGSGQQSTLQGGTGGTYNNLFTGGASGTSPLTTVSNILYNLTIQTGDNFKTWPTAFTNFTGTLQYNSTSGGTIASTFAMGGNVGIGGTGAANTYSGVFTGTGKAFAKFGTDTVTLKPTGSTVEAFTGNTALYAGNLTVDFGNSQTADIINNGSALTLGGSAFALQGGSATLQMTARNATLNQTFNGTTINPGGYIVTVVGNTATFNLHLGAITRSVAGGGVNFTSSGSGTRNLMTTQINNSGIIGPYAIFGGADFATGSAAGSDTTIAAVSATALPTSGGTSTVNYSLTGSQTESGAFTGNTLKLVSSAANQSLALGANNFTVNAIAFSGSGTYTISGSGVLGAGSTSEFIIHQNSASALTNGVPMVGAGSGSLTKLGTGNLTLTAASSYTGNTIVGQGTLQLGAGGSLSSSTSINVFPGATFTFNGNTTTAAAQDLAGSGTINGGLVTMGANGTIHPGGSGTYGTLTFGAGLTEVSTTTNTFDLDAQQSLLDDAIAVTGTLTCGSGVVVINPGTNFRPGTYVLATATTVSGTFNSTVVFASGSGVATLSYTSTSVILTVSSYASCATPASFTVGGGTGCANSGITLTLSGAEIGTTYFVRTNGVINGASTNAVGTGAITFTNTSSSTFTTAGTYTVLASNSCGNTLVMGGSASVNATITNTYNVTGGAGCSSSGVTIGLSSSDVGVAYQLIRGGSTVVTTVAGTGSAISFGSQTTAGTYTVSGTNAGCGTVAINGGTPSSVVITQTPGAPTGLTPVAGDSDISLSWTSPGGTVTDYSVYRTAANGGTGTETLLTNSTGNLTTYDDTTAVNGSAYRYKVSAVNGSCEGVQSSEVFATPNPSFSAFTITTSDPTTTSAGTSVTLTLTAVDGSGSPVTGVAGSLPLTFSGLASAPNGVAASVNGTANGTPVAVTFSSGVGTATLVARKAESATLHVSDGSHTDTSTGGNSGLAFVVSAGTDSAYRLSLASAAPVVGANDALTITIVDQFQNVSSFSGTKNITFGGLSVSPNGTAATVGGTAVGSATAVNFSNPATVQLVAAKAESGRTLTATDGTLTSAATGGATASLSPIAASPTTLSLQTAPSSTANAGTAFATQPVIEVWDAFANVVTTSTVPVTVTASAGNVTGITTVNANGTTGRATFSGLSLTNGGAITLTFAASGLSSTNAVVTVSGGAFVKFAWTSLPTATYGTQFSTPPVFAAVDQYGIRATSGFGTNIIVTVSLATGSGTLSGTTSYNIGTDGSNGVVTMTNLTISGGSGSGYSLQASIAGYGTPVTGMNVWLDASDTSTVTGTSPVTAWGDKSGNGKNMSTTIGSSGTITYANTVNNRKVITFPNGKALVTTSGAYTLTGSATTFFCVVRHAAGGYSQWEGPISSTSGGADWNSTTAWSLDVGNFGAAARLQRNSAAVANNVALPAGGTAYIWNAACDGTSTGNYVGVVATAQSNEVSGTVGFSGAFNVQQISAGGRLAGIGSGTGDWWNGDVGEVIVYNSFLSAANRTAVKTYLYNKWLNTSGSGATLAPTNIVSGTFTVSTISVTITNGVTADNKFFDGTTTATVQTNSSLVLNGVLPADAGSITLVTNGYVANFSSSAVGTWPVTVSGFALAGGQSTNYSLVQPTGLSANISATVSYDSYSITGTAGSMAAGDSQTITLAALNSDGTTNTGFTSPGLTLNFFGLGTAPDGSSATINGASIAGGVTVGFTNGVGTAVLVPHKAESGVTLGVYDALSHSSTNGFGSGLNLDISVGADNAYRITAATSTPQVGASDTLTLNIVDAYRNASGTTGNKNITFGGLASAPDGSSATADGTAFGTPTTISFSGGTASSTLVAHKVQTSALLTATDGSLTAAAAGGTAPSFSPTAGAAASLGISTQPSSTASAGVAFGQQPVVTVLDQYLNTTTSNALVLATASAGTLQGTTTVTANGSGIATYAGLNLTNAGSVTLTFSATGLTSTNSSAITVGGGTATQLVWATAPGGAVNGSVFATQPVLRTADAFGNYSSSGLSSNEQVTVYLSAGTGPLLGTTNYNIGSAGSNGIVTFSDLQVNSANTNATLTATLFSPAATSLAAAAPLWLDANNTASITTNGSGVVSAWNNIGTRGGTLHVATAGGTWTGPTWTGNSMNGKAVMKFVAASSTVGNVMTNSFSPALNLGPNVHLFLAIRQPVNPNGFWSGFIGFSDPAHSAGKFDSTLGEDCGNNSATDQGGFRFFRNDGDASPTSGAAGQYNLNNGLSLGGGVHNMRPANNVAFVNQLYWSASANGGNGAASDNWVDGLGNTWTNYQTTAASKGNFNFVDFGLGSQLGANNDQPVWAQTMDIAEVITYTNVLSTSDSAAIFAYLANKWMNTPLADASTSFTVAKASTTSAVASSSNPSGNLDSLTFTDTVTAYATATGNVVFKVDGVAFSTNTLNGSDIATSIATTSLTRGTRTITAEYAGDSNFLGVTNDLTGGQVVTNHPPVINGDTQTRGSGGVSMKIPVATLLANDTDADGDTITLDSASATTANGATVTLFNGTLFVGASSNSDSFTYTADDGHGGTNTATVTLSITSSTGQQTAVTPTPSNATAYFYGIPGQSYTVQRATNVGFTLGVSNFPSTQAPSGGAFNITDDFGDLGGVVPDSAFYRLLVP